jgi:hypothetical protein
MRGQRDWFWQILETGKGPDCFFTATFDPSNAQRLAELVQRHLPDGFVRDEDFYTPQRRPKYMTYDSYLDSRTYNRMVAMRESGQEQVVSGVGEIEVRDHEFIISHYDSFYDEKELVMTIAQSSDLMLREWKVTYGGNLYAWGELAKGTTAQELIDYLHWKELPDEKPDFEQIKIELQNAMLQAEISEVFELGEFVVGDWLCQALILYKHEPFPDAWSLFETLVVEPVSHKCQVPGNARRGSSPVPQDKSIAAYGNYIQFGYARWSGHEYEDEFQDYRDKQWTNSQKRGRKR